MKTAPWLGFALLALSVGCGKSTVTETSPGTAPTKPAVAEESIGDARTPADGDYKITNTPATVLPVSVDSPPEKVVSEFLNAMKTSDDGVAAGLLTKIA